MKYFFLILISLVMFIFLGCGNNSDSQEPQFPDAPKEVNKDSVALKKIAQADSAYFMQQQINTIHSHGKDLAVHAHQNIPKKRKMLKRAAKLRPKKIAAQKKAKARRKERIAEQQKNQQEIE